MKVSIVLPIYNVAQYLPKCLDCLLSSSLKEIEIVCVNDGSKDNSLEVLEQYAAKEARIKVINQVNLGPGIARNNGIKEATGEYVGFVDPDDWVDTDMFEKMYNTAIKYQADIIECGVTTHQEHTGKTKIKHGFASLIANKPFSPKEHSEYIFDGITSGWNKLCRTAFLRENNIYYSKGFAAEDHYFSIMARLKAQTAVCLSDPMYHYLVRASSLTQNKSIKNLDVPLFLQEITDEIAKSSNVPANFSSYFAADAAGLAAIHYRRVPDDKKDKYLALCKECLPKEANQLFVEFIKPYSIKDKIFSIRHTVKGIQKYKVLTVLGLKFRIKA